MNIELWTALVTPFREDTSLDTVAYRKLLEIQKNAGLGVVLCGSTGEAISLSEEERCTLFNIAKEVEIPFWAGCSSPRPDEALSMAKNAAECGASGILLSTPAYLRPSFEGLEKYFEYVSTAGLPICLYHVPSRTGHYLGACELISLCQIPGVTSLKEASGSLDLVYEVSQEVTTLCGEDRQILPNLMLGARGWVAVLSNLEPIAAKELSENFARDRTRSQLIYKALEPLLEGLIYGNPVSIKTALENSELCSAVVRDPLSKCSQEQKQNIQEGQNATRKQLQALGISNGS